MLNEAFTPPCCSLLLSLSVPITAPFLLLASSPGKGWGMMKAPRHSPILRGPKRALLPLKLLSKALEMKTNMVLICSFFYSIIKPAANLNQRHRIAAASCAVQGEPRPARGRQGGRAAALARGHLP